MPKSLPYCEELSTGYQGDSSQMVALINIIHKRQRGEFSGLKTQLCYLQTE